MGYCVCFSFLNFHIFFLLFGYSVRKTLEKKPKPFSALFKIVLPSFLSKAVFLLYSILQSDAESQIKYFVIRTKLSNLQGKSSKIK